MRITFTTSNVETVEYLRLMSQVLRNNQDVESNVKAYRQLKELTLSLGKRIDELEASARRNRVCR